jgi:hypothetical protein
MEDNEKNIEKKMSDKQRRYIARLLMDKRVDKDYKSYVDAALRSDLSSLQASKVIDFLKNLIDFKMSFVEGSGNNEGVKVFGRSRFDHIRGSGVDNEGHEASFDYAK